MARAIGGWLQGPPLAGGQPPGVRLGLPADGPGSVASFARRFGAYVIDAFVANLVAGLPYLAGVRYSTGTRGFAVLGAFLFAEFIFDVSSGQTIGKRLLGMRLIRVADGGLPRWPWVLLRTLLLGCLIPAVIWDRDQRGLHDKAAGTVVVLDPVKEKPVAALRPPATAASAARPPARAAAARPAAPASGKAKKPSASRRKRRR